MQELETYVLKLNEVPSPVLDALLALANREGISITEDMGIVFTELDYSDTNERILGDFLIDNYKPLISNTIFEFSN
jgi:hypothetical protein